MDHLFLHYRCSFDICEPIEGVDLWGSCVKMVRKWLSHKEQVWNDPAFGTVWFFRGGKWKHPSKRGVFIRTGRVVGTGTEAIPQYWTLSYQHPCSQCSKRIWRTDIGVTILADNRLRINMQVGHHMMAHYLGEIPDIPSPSAPNIITFFLLNKRWRCELGEESLNSEPEPVLLGHAQKLATRIRSSTRTAPIIVLSKKTNAEDPLIDAIKLQTLVGGVANVCVLADRDVADEFDYYMTKKYRCNDGMVRIYLPNVEPQCASDHLRHRFFLPRDIEEFDPSNVLKMIVRMLCRYTPRKKGQSVYSIDELVLVERGLRLAELRENRGKEESDDEWKTLYEHELDSQSQQIEELEASQEKLQFQIMAQDDDFSRLEFEKKSAFMMYESSLKQVDDMKRKVKGIQSFQKLPSNLEEVLTIIGNCHSDKVIIAEKAVKSAKEYSSFSDISLAWSCLWAMATTLHDLYFGGSTGDVERSFREQTGFELALNEGRQTQRNKDLMRLRKLHHDGEEYDITPHAKAGGNKEPKCLRIYYSTVPDSQKIIIGHCGAHLDNSTTAKLH
jgi:predicted metal-dependent phosphoesterase TrpH